MKTHLWSRFGYPVLISIDFDNFTLPVNPEFFVSIEKIYQTLEPVFLQLSITSNFVKNTTQCIVLIFLHCKPSSWCLDMPISYETLSLVFDILLTSNTGHLVGISVPKLTDHHEISVWISAASNALLRPL